jgi:hypothetical protein
MINVCHYTPTGDGALPAPILAKGPYEETPSRRTQRERRWNEKGALCSDPEHGAAFGA